MNTHEDRAAQVARTWATEVKGDFRYYEKMETLSNGFWRSGSLWVNTFNQLDHRVVLEIACGAGRHIQEVLNGPYQVERYIAVDTSPDALARVKERFKDDPRLEVYQIEGDCGLPEDLEGVTTVFSYDSMVHFELLTVWGYLQQIHRVLVPGGKALLHHSNYSENPEGDFQTSPGWRNYMTESTFRHLASRAGLVTLNTRLIDWCRPKSDALSLLQRPN